MIVKTNVKINLGLNVLRRRPDGYHDIETLFVPCYSYGDVIEIITGDDFSRTSARLFAKYSPMDFRLHLDEAPMIAQGISPDGKLMITIAREAGVGWNPLNDLCAKAYELLAKDFKLPPVKIFLEKNAPVGAGLGGGSADAAFVLKALNELFALGLNEDEPSADGKPSIRLHTDGRPPFEADLRVFGGGALPSAWKRRDSQNRRLSVGVVQAVRVGRRPSGGVEGGDDRGAAAHGLGRRTRRRAG